MHVVFPPNRVSDLRICLSRRREPLRIGDLNLISISSRIESPSVGSFNTFLPRSSTASTTRVSSNCVIGAGCVLLPSPSLPEGEDEVLEPYTVLYLVGEGENERRVLKRTWDGSGEASERDLRIKHVEYLREVQSFPLSLLLVSLLPTSA